MHNSIYDILYKDMTIERAKQMLDEAAEQLAQASTKYNAAKDLYDYLINKEYSKYKELVAHAADVVDIKDKLQKLGTRAWKIGHGLPVNTRYTTDETGRVIINKDYLNDQSKLT